MTVPALSLSLPADTRLKSTAAVVVGALGASAVATSLAVLTHMLSSWHWGVGSVLHSNEDAFAGAVASSVMAPVALALVLYGLDAKGAARILAGGAAFAPAVALRYLFLGGTALDDGLLAFGVAALAGLLALSVWQGEKRGARMHGWAALAALGFAGLWEVGVHLRPAQVWVELPF